MMHRKRRTLARGHSKLATTEATAREKKSHEVLFAPGYDRTRSGPYLEVVAYWGSTVMAVEHFHAEKKGYNNQVVIGDPSKGAIATGRRLLEQQVLADLDEDATELRLQRGMKTKIKQAGTLVKREDPGEVMFRQGDKAKISYGPLVYYVHYVQPPKVQLPPWQVGNRLLLNLGLIALVAYMALIPMVYLASPVEDSFSDELPTVPWDERYTKVVVDPPPPTPRPVPPTQTPEPTPRRQQVERPVVSQTNPVTPPPARRTPPPVRQTPPPVRNTPRPTVAVVRETSLPQNSTTQQVAGRPTAQEGQGSPGVARRPRPNLSGPGAGQTGQRRLGQSRPGASRAPQSQTAGRPQAGTAQGNNPRPHTMPNLSALQGSSQGARLRNLPNGIPAFRDGGDPSRLQGNPSRIHHIGGPGNGRTVDTIGQQGDPLGRLLARGNGGRPGGGGGLVGTNRPGFRRGQPIPPQVPQLGGPAGPRPDEGAILAIMRRHFNAIRHCYEKTLAYAPQTGGKMTVKFTVNSGRVSRAQTVPLTSIADQRMQACVLKRVRQMNFATLKRFGTFDITFPFVFNRL